MLTDACDVQQSNRKTKYTFQRYFNQGNCPDLRLNNANEYILYFVHRYEQNKCDIMIND